MIVTNEQLKIAESAVKTFYKNDHTGHGWDHIVRVRNLAMKIADLEGVTNFNLIELLSLLHDAGDEKLHESNQAAESFLNSILSKLGLSKEEEGELFNEIKSISYRNRHIYKGQIESKIVSDADRLDAIGAIGIARAFTYGGARGVKLHSQKKGESSVMSHFSEKLLNLKNEMHTKTAYKIAVERDRFLKLYRDQFLNEWNGKK
ncbi:HD domain-containing protein [Jeotgalibacillus sp. JSM ZJ347]|uniref:HD domain-containing protein n=1 Tax=Jeotgalibacillus sp. JSM ZJ347 TaxID=3342117 RepID=UPI0035A90BE8